MRYSQVSDIEVIILKKYGKSARSAIAVSTMINTDHYFPSRGYLPNKGVPVRELMEVGTCSVISMEQGLNS